MTVRRISAVFLLAAVVGFGRTPPAGADIWVDGLLCTLPAAIRAANTDAPSGFCSPGSGADVLFLGSPVKLSTPDSGSSAPGGAAAGLPDVTSDVTIVGVGGSVIERDPDLGCSSEGHEGLRLFNVLGPGAALRLHGLTLANGCAVGGSPARGGAVYLDGSTLTLEGTRVVGNRAESAGGAEGGAIYGNAATVAVASSELAGNVASGVVEGERTGGFAAGGAVFLVDSSFTALAGTELVANAALAAGGAGDGATGGALHLTGAGSCDVALSDVVLAGNTARAGDGPAGGAARGGGGFVDTCTVTTLERLVAADNAAIGGAGDTLDGGAAAGGGLYLEDLAAPPAPPGQDPLAVELRLGWFTANEARGGASALARGGAALGGGLWARDLPGLLQGTFDGNRAVAAGGATGDPVSGPDARGGGAFLEAGVVALQRIENVTFAANEAIGGAASGSGEPGGAAAGGGLFVRLTSAGSRLRHLTVVRNTVRPGEDAGGGGVAGPAGITAEGATASGVIDNSLFADNVVVAPGGALQAWDMGDGSIASGGHNRYEDDFGAGLFDQAGDVGGPIGGLGLVADNGCAEVLASGTCLPTVGLAPTSEAVDQGSCSPWVAADARGVARPQDQAPPDAADGCDVGAFELEAGRGAVILVLDLVPDGSTDVAFSLDGGAPFALDDDGLPEPPGTVSLPLAPGIHEVAAAVPAGYVLTALSCVDPSGGTVANYPAGSASADVAAGESVTCTFELSAPSAGSFFTVAPCRVYDTRFGPGALASGTPRLLALHGQCGIPRTATAVAVNVTAVAPGGNGFLTFGPGDGAPTNTSVVNFGAGQTRANNAVLGLAADGSGTVSALAVLDGNGLVDLILDVVGYFE